MVFRRFRIFETSEKTVENNILADITNVFQQSFHRQITIISPTQRQERFLGFDDILDGLPPGLTYAFQFKRPHAYPSRKFSDFVKFTIHTRQLQTLFNHFLPGEAFYIFLPLPLTQEIILNRRNLLNIGMALDIYRIPNPTKITQHTRAVRVTRPHLPPNIEIADPGIFETVKAETLKEWCINVGNKKLRKRKVTNEFRFLKKGKKFPKLRDIHYIHISED